MVHKKDKTHHDFTGVGEMTEFLHPDDEEAELKFKQLNALNSNSPLEIPPDLPHSILNEGHEEIPRESTDSEFDLFETNLPEEKTEIVDTEEIFDNSSIEDISFESTAVLDETPEIEAEQETTNFYTEDFAEEVHQVYAEPETFKDVQNFANNFSYSSPPTGGNPPFSIIIKNLKFSEDVESILIFLKEFQIITPESEEDYKKSMSYGFLLIPQISEYLAILLTHKLRRFDIDIEIGLSDQIHPSKSEEYNPRGLTSRTHLSQNKSDHHVMSRDQITPEQMLVTTTGTFVGHKIEKYLGIETAFRIIDSDDLDRLHFIQQSLNGSLDFLGNQEKNDYLDFTNNFHQIYTDLINELKEMAFQKSANSLLGLSFTLTPFLSEKNLTQNKYQLSCTATLAFIIKDI
jgi:uncharacterized protein YbjQ (UPF0145 family)